MVYFNISQIKNGKKIYIKNIKSTKKVCIEFMSCMSHVHRPAIANETIIANDSH